MILIYHKRELNEYLRKVNICECHCGFYPEPFKPNQTVTSILISWRFYRSTDKVSETFGNFFLRQCNVILFSTFSNTFFEGVVKIDLTTPSKKVLEKVEKSIALVCKLQSLLHRIFTFAYYYTAELYYGDNTFDILCKIDGDKFALTILTWKNFCALLNSLQKFIEFKVGCFWRFHIFTQPTKFF